MGDRRTRQQIIMALDAQKAGHSESNWPAEFIRRLPQGAYGNLFITDRAMTVGGSERVREVFIQRRKVARLEGTTLTLIPPEAADLDFHEDRHARRQGQEAYDVGRAQLGHRIMEKARGEVEAPLPELDFEGWNERCERIASLTGIPFTPGQKGGYFTLRDGLRISALGAVAAAQTQDTIRALAAE